MPRLPTDQEKEENAELGRYMQENHLHDGIMSSHNYSIISTKEVGTKKGIEKLIKLRNPWLGEKWTGKYSLGSEELTESLQKELKVTEIDSVEGEFWISIVDIMWYFEIMNICKTNPHYLYNSLYIHFPKKRFTRAVVRVSVPKKGKYTFSVDQKDSRIFPS